MHVLELTKIEKRFKDKTAVSQVSVTLKSGVYGLLGENGAGKTTLMRMLCGILQPTEGYIACDDIPISELSGEYRRLLGYLPQDFGYYGDFSAFRFLDYMSALKAVPKDYARTKIEELLELTGLLEVKDKKLKTFSGGMIRRVGIAQALLNDPEILILDEPTSGLDPRERVRFRNIISSLSKGRMILLSTHIVADVESIADEILLMDKGRLVRTGTVESFEKAVEGCVWECRVSEEEAALYHTKYCISNLKNLKDGVRLRIISEQKPAEGAVQAEAGLEDAYLFLNGYEGGKASETLSNGIV